MFSPYPSLSMVAWDMALRRSTATASAVFLSGQSRVSHVRYIFNIASFVSTFGIREKIWSTVPNKSVHKGNKSSGPLFVHWSSIGQLSHISSATPSFKSLVSLLAVEGLGQVQPTLPNKNGG